MWTWIVLAAGYVVVLFFFHILGGIGAAANAIQTWGRRSSERAVERSGASPGSYARSRLAGRGR